MNRDPWGVPITSDPLWASQTGVVPLASLNAQGQPQPDAGPQPVPGQPPLPGQPGGPPAAGSGGSPSPPGAPKPPAAGAAPGKPSSAPAETAGANKPQAAAGNAGQTPGHSAAEAGADVHTDERGQGSGSSAAPASKAAWAELDALERHLRKGRDPASWDARHLPGDVLEVVRFDLGDGQSITTAVADAKTALAKTGG